MLTVYGRKSSFNLQKVMWLVGELGIEHRHVELGGSFGGLEAAEFRALNPHGRVPVIKDGGTVVWESHAILRYLAARYGGRFWHDDAGVRAQWEQWMDWSQCTLQPDFLVGVFWGFYRTPEPQRDMAAVTARIRRTGEHMQLLDQVLEGRRYLLGDALTLADIPAATNLHRYFGLDIARPPVPNVERWYATLKQHAGYRDHVMVPFGDLYGRLAY